MTVQQHAKLAPSRSPMWMVCPGSVRMSKGEPDVAGEAAKEGTGVHAMIEHLLKKDLFRSSRLPKKIKYGYDSEILTLEVTKHHKYNVQIMLDTVKECMTHDQIVFHSEKKSDATFVHPKLWGTADVAIDNYPELVVIDYKNGYVPVFMYDYENAPDKPEGIVEFSTEQELNDMEVCTQVLIYAAGIANEWGWMHEVVTLIIVQPNAFEVPDVQKCRISITALKSWAENTLFEKAHNTEMADAPLVAGPHCRWCPAIAKCPAFAERATKEAKMEFDELIEEYNEPLVPADEEHIARILKMAPAFDQWLRMVEEKALDLLRQGKMEGHGYKVVRGRANRKWPENLSETQIFARIKKLFPRMSKTKAFLTKLRSPAQMEEVGVKAEFVNKVAFKPEGKLTVALITDPRPSADVKSDFEGVQVDTSKVAKKKPATKKKTTRRKKR